MYVLFSLSNKACTSNRHVCTGGICLLCLSARLSMGTKLMKSWDDCSHHSPCCNIDAVWLTHRQRREGTQRSHRAVAILPFWVLERGLPSSCLKELKIYPALRISTASDAFPSISGLTRCPTFRRRECRAKGDFCELSASSQEGRVGRPA